MAEKKEPSISVDRFSCPLCLDLLKDPVTISCGHSFCMKCINDHWDQRRIYRCPQCREKFNTRPELWRKTGSGKNVMPRAESGYVEHKLGEASSKLQEKICSQHGEPLKRYCRTDKRYICFKCLNDEHKGHDTVPAEIERRRKRVDCQMLLTLTFPVWAFPVAHGTQPRGLYIPPVPEVFIPEMFETAFKNNNSYRFLHQHSGQFQCKVTSLVFEVEEIKGEVLYRIDSWDTRLLDGLGQMKPAGPLYNIDCFKGSVSHLHLPHCEILTEEHQVELVVAHFTGANVEIIQPLKVTNTHVIISIQGFSLFGLLIRRLFNASPINGQVLLFYKDITGRRSRKKLHIHLLPGNVPAEEVKDQHTDFRTIKTSSRCQLTPGRKYRPSCDPYRYQPKVEQFECDYGPNYHPTFEVFLHSETEELTIGLLDEQDLEIWEPRLILLTDDDTDAATPKMNLAGAEQFVDENRSQLIQKVPSVMEIADCLKSKVMITEEMYSNIQAGRTSQEQMRMLYEALKSGGAEVKAEFYHILKRKLPHLVKKLHQTSWMRPPCNSSTGECLSNGFSRLSFS